MNPYRIIFAGTPDFAAEALIAILQSQHNVVAVYTQPDRRAGRGQKVIHSPVKQLALKHSIPVEQPPHFKDTNSLDQLRQYNADIMVVAAYGIILPSEVLNEPKYGCINIHASLLPRWRGAAPIQRAIAQGDTQTGITIMLMDEGLDTGDMLHKTTLAIENNDTGYSLHNKLAKLGASSLITVLDNLPNYLSQASTQNEKQASYAKKLSKKEAQIDWSQPAQSIYNKVRAFKSWPVAFGVLNGQTIRLWEVDAKIYPHNFKIGEICSVDASYIAVACKDGHILLKTLQLPGKKALPCTEILRGKKDFFVIGQCFES